VVMISRAVFMKCLLLVGSVVLAVPSAARE
jgi:hypothetical protein